MYSTLWIVLSFVWVHGFPTDGGVSIPLEPHIKGSIGKKESNNTRSDEKWQPPPSLRAGTLKTFHRLRSESWQVFPTTPASTADWVVDWHSALKGAPQKGKVPLIAIPQDVGYLARIQIGSQKQPFTGETRLCIRM